MEENENIANTVKEDDIPKGLGLLGRMLDYLNEVFYDLSEFRSMARKHKGPELKSPEVVGFYVNMIIQAPGRLKNYLSRKGEE